jgi:hypothetical protein
LHAVLRRFMRRCDLAVFHRSARRRCSHMAADRFIQANALPHLNCVRHRPSHTAGLFIHVEVRSRVPVHTPWQLSRNAVVSCQSRITEIRLSPTCGTSETPERSSRIETIYEAQTISGTEIICGTQTICGMERTTCVVTGKNMFSLIARGIGIATGTAIATTGGMVTNAPLSMERG